MHAALFGKTECVEAIISHHSKEPADLMGKMSKGKLCIQWVANMTAGGTEEIRKLHGVQSAGAP